MAAEDVWQKGGGYYPWGVYYSDIEKEICIQVGMGESQTIKTMIHEVAHAMLHTGGLSCAGCGAVL